MRRTITILLALTLATGFILPLASANWKYRGTNEPDTARDVSDGLMFLEPDTNPDAGVKKVYFNVFGKLTSETSYNGNVALTGSRVQPVDTGFTGLLGIWKDCNNDGYIGMSEYGLIEYRAELLLDSSICPKASATAGAPYPHNDGFWIREFIFIGSSSDGNARNPNPTVFTVNETEIWGDWNLPGQTPRIVCPLGGNLGTRSTGAMLDYADCLTGYKLMDNLNAVQAETGLPVGGWDKENPEESNAFLNVDNPAYTALYGPNQDGREGVMGRDDKNSGYEAPAMYEAYDCDSTAVAGRPGPSGSTSVNPSGSAYETANDTYNVARLGQCEKANDNGLFYTRIDGSNEATQPFRGKVSADHEFLFAYGNRNHLRSAAAILGPNAPADAGLGPNRELDAVGPAYRSNAGILTGPQIINRNSLEPASANYMTFYARLGSTAGLTVANADPKVYGAENCVGGIEGTDGIASSDNVQNGWNCDPDTWVKNCQIQNPPTKGAQCHNVGEAYHLRDIDCWDGQLIRTLPIYASSVQLKENGTCEVNDAYEEPIS